MCEMNASHRVSSSAETLVVLPRLHGPHCHGPDEFGNHEHEARIGNVSGLRGHEADAMNHSAGDREADIAEFYFFVMSACSLAWE